MSLSIIDICTLKNIHEGAIFVQRVGFTKFGGTGFHAYIGLQTTRGDKRMRRCASPSRPSGINLFRTSLYLLHRWCGCEIVFSSSEVGSEQGDVQLSYHFFSNRVWLTSLANVLCDAICEYTARVEMMANPTVASFSWATDGPRIILDVLINNPVAGQVTAPSEV